MSPKLRSCGRGCPICGRQRRIAATIARNRLPCPPERSLALRYPELLAEWHQTLNGDLDPRTVAAGPERKVWWCCAECGHEWATAINDRTRRRSARRGPHGCPACARAQHIARQAKLAIPSRQRSFGALYPHLVCEWHPTRNGDLNPYHVKPYSERKVWWRCAQCGHQWRATPGTRTHSPRGGCCTCAVTHAQRERRANARRAVGDS
jgi:Probable Zinc-ribbon domain